MIPCKFNVLFLKMIIISNHNHFLILLHFYVFLYNKLQFFLTHHVHFTPFMYGKGLLKILILDQFWKVLWIFKVLKFHIFLIMSVLLMWLIGVYPLNIFLSNVFYYISPFDSPLQNWLLFNTLLFTFKGPKSKF